MSYKGLLVTAFLFSFFSLQAQYLNVKIDDVDLPEEPSIAINPKNPNQMVAGANINFYYHTDDGGLTWQKGLLDSPWGVWGDPCIIVDTNGYFYFIHLANPPSPGTWIDRIVIQKSTDGGITWSDGSYVGKNGDKAQDKAWATVDRTNNYIYLTWTQFDHYGSALGSDSSIILFSRSIDGGLTWSDPKRINKVAGDCIDSDNTVEGAVPAVGPDGEVYVSWSGPAGLVFTKSTDHGDTWPEENILVNTQPGGWDMNIPGISRSNGMPVTCCNLNSGPYHGEIYINWADQRNGPGDTDIWFAKSTDGGNTWSAAKRVNDDPAGKQQFFTWMAVDPVTGHIYIVFYDRRSYTDTRTDVYLARSDDGGATFVNTKISTTPFEPQNAIFFGDYTNIAAYNNIVRPIYVRLDTFHISVNTTLIDSILTGPGQRLEEPLPISLEQNYPNPVRDISAIAFKVRQPSYVSLKVYDLLGRTQVVLVNGRAYSPGKYIQYLDNSNHRLLRGFYYYSLSTGDRSLQRKMIVE
jgi:hypothetical protein